MKKFLLIGLILLTGCYRDITGIALEAGYKDCVELGGVASALVMGTDQQLGNPPHLMVTCTDLTTFVYSVDGKRTRL